jgi:hypothetical protein
MQMTLGASRFFLLHLPPATNYQQTTGVIVSDKILQDVSIMESTTCHLGTTVETMTGLNQSS